MILRRNFYLVQLSGRSNSRIVQLFESVEQQIVESTIISFKDLITKTLYTTSLSSSANNSGLVGIVYEEDGNILYGVLPELGINSCSFYAVFGGSADIQKYYFRAYLGSYYAGKYHTEDVKYSPDTIVEMFNKYMENRLLGRDRIILDGKIMRTFKEAYEWLKSKYPDTSYDIDYDCVGEPGTYTFVEVIFITCFENEEVTESYDIYSFEDLKEFISKH